MEGQTLVKPPDNFMQVVPVTSEIIAKKQINPTHLIPSFSFIEQGDRVASERFGTLSIAYCKHEHPRASLKNIDLYF